MFSKRDKSGSTGKGLSSFVSDSMLLDGDKYQKNEDHSLKES